jgi:hypothetical protein
MLINNIACFGESYKIYEAIFLNYTTKDDKSDCQVKNLIFLLKKASQFLSVKWGIF